MRCILNFGGCGYNRVKLFAHCTVIIRPITLKLVCAHNYLVTFEDPKLMEIVAISLALSPGPFPAFQCCTLKSRRAWYQNRFYPHGGGRRVKINVGDQKVSKGLGVAVHDQLEVRL